MKKPFLVFWATGCSSNFSTLEKAEARINAGLHRLDGNLQRGAAKIYAVSWKRPLIKEIKP